MKKEHIFQLVVPVYWEYYKGRGKKKKKRLSLISYNWFINMDPFSRRDFKRKYKEMLSSALSKIETKQIKGKYRVEYIYNYKNDKSDLPNVISVISKEFNDLLQELTIGQDDNVKFLLEERSIVGSKTKEPHVIIKIYSMEN